MTITIQFDGCVTRYPVTGCKNAQAVAECLTVAMRAYGRGRDVDGLKCIRRVLLGEDISEDTADSFDLQLWASVIPNAELCIMGNKEGDLFAIAQHNDSMRDRNEEPWKTIAVRQDATSVEQF